MTVQNLLFCAHTLCMKNVTNTFLLVRSSKWSKQLLCFCTVNAKKANKNLQQRTLSGFITIPLLLTMVEVNPVQMRCQCFYSVVRTNFFYDLLKDNGKFSEPRISTETIKKLLYGNFERSFLMVSRKISRHFLHANSFMFMLLISNHTVFSRSIWN